MADRECPECSRPLAFNAKACKCGWRLAPMRESHQSSDREHLRCEWVSSGVRCRYVGSITADARGGGPWFCVGHFGCDDPAHGARIVDESQAERGDDWSAGSLVGKARARFIAKLEAQAEREAIQADA